MSPPARAPSSSTSSARATSRARSHARGASALLTLALAACSREPAAPPSTSLEPRVVEGVEYLGRATIDGRETDLSPPGAPLEDGSPSNRFGAFGSALDWTGTGELYLAASDRGPNDGATTYRCRWHELEIRVRPGASPPVAIELRRTVMMVDGAGLAFTGSESMLAPQGPFAGRLDPEGLRVTPDGHVWIADEYGPALLEFDREGKLLRRVEPPLAFRVERPQVNAKDELQLNARGRMPNRAFQGLAFDRARGRLAAIMRGALIQDGAATGLVCRVLEFSLADAATSQRAVALDAVRNGFNELLHVERDRYLAYERGAESSEDRRTRRIVVLDFANADEVSARERITSPSAVRCATKQLLVDLLDKRWGITREGLPEKVEALCFGPDLPDGRRLLLVASDNDLEANQSSVVWAFAIERERLAR